MVTKLYDQLHGGFHGCSAAEHAEQLLQHNDEVGEEPDKPLSLSKVANDPAIIDVLHLEGTLAADGVMRRLRGKTAQWREAFCGIPADGSQLTPHHVCLHREEALETRPQATFDIDSFLGFARSLAFCKQGLYYRPSPLYSAGLRTDVHLEISAMDDDERFRQKMLKDVAHVSLGEVDGARHIVVYVLFPRLAYQGATFHALTGSQMTRWTDNVFLPVLHELYDANYLQHLPASYSDALNRASARKVELRA